MRVLVVGAGAVGAYFGGRLVEKGADVTFLVREHRHKKLQANGLVLHSVKGDASFSVNSLVAGETQKPFDLILLTTKAYHLQDVLPGLAPYVSENSAILPLLNGIAHFDILKNYFGAKKIIGGLCFIESTLNAQGEVEHYSTHHRVVFGEFNHEKTERIKRIEQLFTGANLEFTSSDNIQNDIWKKYIFISAMAGMTCLTRSSLGPIMQSPGGPAIYERLLHEICTIGKYQEPSLDEDVWEQTNSRVRSLPAGMKSSMLRDMEKGLPIETDHFHRTLLELAPTDLDTPILQTIYSTLSIYQAEKGGNK
jgi:2-dehydropantoate 2-reductase